MKSEQPTFDFYESTSGIKNFTYGQEEIKWKTQGLRKLDLEMNLLAMEEGMEWGSFEEIDAEVDRFADKGYMFLQMWTIGFKSPDRIKLPSGKILDNKELCQLPTG